MTTHAYLSQALRFERMTRNKILEIERYKEMATSTTVATKQDVVQSSGSKDKMGTLVAKIIDLEKDISNITVVRDKIISQIEGVSDPDMYQVLYSKYVDDVSLNQVSRIIHCSKTQIYRIYDKALAEFERKYGKYYLDVS